MPTDGQHFWSALTATFYLSLGAFAAASLTSLLGATFVIHPTSTCPAWGRCW